MGEVLANATNTSRRNRREFLARAAASAGSLLGPVACRTTAATGPAAPARGPLPWPELRRLFALDREHVHLALLLLASHPQPVREAIDRHRRALDSNPVTYWIDQHERLEIDVRNAAAAHLGGRPDEIALTGSTTAGLALVYGGLPLRPGDEILTTTHDHYSTYESLRLRAAHTGAAFRKIPLYAAPATASVDEIVSKLRAGIAPRTRVVAVTWVHSSTGVKLPVRAIADVVAEVNRRRDPVDHVLLSVDGVHGFGIERERPVDLGCDFFVAGCHKWLFGPRGTGFVWGRTAAWKGHVGIVPSFEWAAYEAWMRGEPPDKVPPGPLASPGGFHAFEHRWALADAFRFHQSLGAERVAARVHELASHCKAGLAAIAGVTVHTPKDPALSGGLVCFDVAGHGALDVVKKLLARKIVSSPTPYATSHARFTPSIVNTDEEIDRAVAEVAALAAGKRA